MANLICQNTGSYNRKTKSSLGEIIKPTLMQKAELNIDVENYIILGNQKYIVGEGVRDIQSRVDSEVHKVCTIYDILKNSKHLDTVNIMLALPSNYYLNKDYRMRYKRLLDNVLTGEVNGVNKTVFVNKVEVYMECAAAYLVHKHKYKGPVGVIDIGGNTIVCAIFIDGMIVKESIVTLDIGMLKMQRDLIDSLNINHPGWNVQQYEIRGLMSDTSDKLVESVMDNYMLLLKGALLEKKWNLGRIPLLATGGGAVDLEVYLKRILDNLTVSDSGVLDNVRGMWQVGQVIFE